MKNLIKLFGITTFAAVIVFSLTSAVCGSRSSNDGSDSTSSESGGGAVNMGSVNTGNGALVGKWYGTQEEANRVAEAVAKGTPIYAPLESLRLGMAGQLPDDAVIDTVAYEFTSDGKLHAGNSLSIATYTATADTVTLDVSGNTATADYRISGNTLTINQHPNQGPGGWSSGTFYKAK
ncbi:MAG: hypothetical protein FWC19_04035 [Treponema sp.]|nr:hypothetical protein [Treponema sp.]